MSNQKETFDFVYQSIMQDVVTLNAKYQKLRKGQQAVLVLGEVMEKYFPGEKIEDLPDIWESNKEDTVNEFWRQAWSGIFSLLCRAYGDLDLK